MQRHACRRKVVGPHSRLALKRLPPMRALVAWSPCGRSLARAGAFDLVPRGQPHSILLMDTTVMYSTVSFSVS